MVSVSNPGLVDSCLNLGLDREHNLSHDVPVLFFSLNVLFEELTHLLNGSVGCSGKFFPLDW